MDRAVRLETQATEPRWWSDGCDGSELTGRPVGFEQPPKVDIGDPIAVSEKEGAVREPGSKSPNAAAGLSVQARVDEMDGPGVPFRLVALNCAAAEFDGHVAVEGEIVHEEALHVVRSVPHGDDELRHAIVSVVLHDVPEDGPPAYVD